MKNIDAGPNILVLAALCFRDRVFGDLRVFVFQLTPNHGNEFESLEVPEHPPPIQAIFSLNSSGRSSLCILTEIVST